MDDKGWITLHRKMLKNPIVCKDSDYFAVWVYLLLNATHKDVSALFKGKRITLKPGQLITGSKSIGEQFNINYVKVHRILKVFESEKQIEKQSSNKNSLITIVNWHLYQDYEKQIEIQVKNNCNSSEIQVKTNNNDNNVTNNTKENIKRKVFIKPTLEEVTNYCKERNNNISPSHFIDYYETRGWELSKGRKMKDWKACIRTWEQRSYDQKPKEEKLPDWFGKEIKQEDKFTDEQRRELEEIERQAYKS